MRTKLSASVVLVLLLLVAPSARGQDALRWESRLQDAARQAAATNRLVLVHFWAPWCVACRKMDQEIFSQPDVQAAIDADYVAVRLNVDHNQAIAQQYGVSELPTDVVVLPDGRLVDRRPGFLDRYQYVARLRQIAVDTRRPPVVMPQTRPEVSPAMIAGPPAAGPSQPPAVAPNQPPAAAWPNVAQAPVQGPTGPAGSSFDAGPPSQPAPPNQPMPGQIGLPTPDAANPAVVANQPWHADPRTQANIQAAPAQPPASAEPPAYWQSPFENRQAPPQQAPPRQDFVAQQANPGYPPSGPIAPAAEPQANPSGPQAGPPSDPKACPFALDGFCPVELVENKAWKLGDIRYGANHRGRTYLFSGPEQQQRFLQDPDRYSPAASGVDVVLAVTREQIVPGRREYGVFCANRVFLFANEDTLAAFSAQPEQYLERLESLNQSTGRPTYR